ncbi:MAG TPA: MucR family transcriptional regulator, partial [Desulfuromonadales bacterium]|nr:MucR family transcriptional regulator [Desulfuromonadales bacterium]
MAADIVAAHASTTNMTKEELVSELNEIYNALNTLEKGDALTDSVEEESVP